jgi:hypothetical protein
MCGYLVKPSGRLVPPDLVVIVLALHDSISPNNSAWVHAVGTTLPKGGPLKGTPYSMERHSRRPLSKKATTQGAHTQHAESLLSGGSLVGVGLCAGPFICGGPGQLLLSLMPKSGPDQNPVIQISRANYSPDHKKNPCLQHVSYRLSF